MGTITERKTGKGKIVYDASIRRRGSPTAYKSFKRRTDARCWLQDIESSMRAGAYLPQAEAQRHKLAEAIDRYITEELPKKPRSYRNQKRELLWFKARIGEKFLSEVTPAILTEIKGQFLREPTRYRKLRCPPSWNRYLSPLSCVFQMCIGDWQWMETNPARRVKRERESPGRVRFLSDDERSRLLEVCKASRSPNLYPLVVLALSTGMRRGEITNLTWEQVDLPKAALILDDTKNQERRRVAVRGLALELMREHARVRRIDTNLVFPGEKTYRTGKPFELQVYWREAVSKANLKDFRFHDLRHSCASCLAMTGASLLEIAEVLGHKTLQMVKRYSHLAETHTASVVERMNKQIFG